MIWEPIEKRYSLSAMRDRQMLNSSAFAIAAGVVSVGSATAGGIMSSQAASKAAGAQAAAGKKLTKQTQKATDRFLANQEKLQQEIAKIDPNINLPEYSLREATEAGIRSSNKITLDTLAQLKNVTGKDPTQVIGNALDTLAKWENRLSNEYVQVQRGVPLVDQQQAVVSELVQGNLPQRTLQRISQNLAEFGGAGFSMQAAGRSPFIQSPQAMLAENIRQSSEERMMRGLALAPGITQQRSAIAGTTSGLAGQAGNLSNIARGWMTTAYDFISPVFGSMQLGAQGRSQDIAMQEANIANQFKRIGFAGDINSQIFGAQTGQAQLGYQTQQATNEAMLARDMANVSAIQGIGEAGAGALGGISNARIAQMRAGGVGGFNYEQVYGRAIPAGGTTAPGFGNFDYGV
jgi:hypothetical protein